MGDIERFNFLHSDDEPDGLVEISILGFGFDCLQATKYTTHLWKILHLFTASIAFIRHTNCLSSFFSHHCDITQRLIDWIRTDDGFCKNSSFV